MKIVVEMTSEEFQEFLAWRSDKQMYDRETEKTRGKLEHIFNKVLWALTKDDKKPDKVKIENREHAVELLDMANDWFS